MSSKIILCQVKRADEPYYIEDINRYLYSIEELCWFVDHNLALVDDAFFDTTLTDWIRGELQLPDLADRMDRIMSSGSEEDESADEKAFIAGIDGVHEKSDGAEAEAESAAEGSTENRTENKTENNTESGADSGSVLSRLIYVLNAEISWIYVPDRQAFREEISGLRRMSAGERMKRRADTLISYEKYTRALQIYKRILRDEEEEGRLKPYMETVSGSGKSETDTGTADMTAENTADADTSADKAEVAEPTGVDATAADTAVSGTEEVSGSADLDAEAVGTTDTDTTESGTTAADTEAEAPGSAGMDAEAVDTTDTETTESDITTADTDAVTPDITVADAVETDAASDTVALDADAMTSDLTSEEATTGEKIVADDGDAGQVSGVDAAAEEISAEETAAEEVPTVASDADEASDSETQGMTELTADGSEAASSAVMAESTGIAADRKTEITGTSPDKKTESAADPDDAQENSMATDERTAILCSAVWHNMGVAYARLFQFDEACGCMKRAYNLLRSNEILRDYLCCVLISRGREAFDDLADRLGTDTVTRADIVSSVENIPVKKTPANIDEALNTWVRDYHRQTAP